MAGLLVSVRSAEEARAALAGGADVIDVKEPQRGPLGRADSATWQAVRAVMPPNGTLSVALGELADHADPPEPDAWRGIHFRKIGLAAARPDWLERWRSLLDANDHAPPWVAVAYADWRHAGAPEPDAVREAAGRLGCVGLLIDTWDKARPSPLHAGEPWRTIIRDARQAGLFVALAGSLNCGAIRHLAALQPDLFAVRGAACGSGDRLGTVDARRVAELARTVRCIVPRGYTGLPGQLIQRSR